MNKKDHRKKNIIVKIDLKIKFIIKINIILLIFILFLMKKKLIKLINQIKK